MNSKCMFVCIVVAVYIDRIESTKFPDDPWPADIMFTDDFNSALVQFCNKTPEYTSLSPQDMCTYDLYLYGCALSTTNYTKDEILGIFFFEDPIGLSGDTNCEHLDTCAESMLVHIWDIRQSCLIRFIHNITTLADNDTHQLLSDIVSQKSMCRMVDTFIKCYQAETTDVFCDTSSYLGVLTLVVQNHKMFSLEAQTDFLHQIDFTKCDEQTTSAYPTSALSWETTTVDQNGFTDDDTTFTFWTHVETTLSVSTLWPPFGSDTTFDWATTHRQTVEIRSSLKDGRFPVKAIVGVCAGVAVLLMVVVVICIAVKRRTRKRQAQHKRSKNKRQHIPNPNHGYEMNKSQKKDLVANFNKYPDFEILEKSSESQISSSLQTITNNLPDNETYSHIAGGLTRAIVTDNTYSHIPNTTTARLDNTYSHLPIEYGHSVTKDGENIDVTYSHLGETVLINHPRNLYNSRAENENNADNTYSRVNPNLSAAKAKAEYGDDTYNHLGETYNAMGNGQQVNITGLNGSHPHQYAVVNKQPTLETTASGPGDHPHEYFVLEPQEAAA